MPGNSNKSYMIDIDTPPQKKKKKMFPENYYLKGLMLLAHSPQVAHIGEIGNELRTLNACRSHMSHFR